MQMKRFRIELLVGLLLLLPCLVSSKRTPRGFRPSGRKPARYRSLQKVKGTADDPTLEPTGEDTMAAKVVEKQVGEEEALAAQEEEEEEEEEEEDDDEEEDIEDPKKAAKEDKKIENDDEDEDETAAPSFATSNSTSDSPTTSPNGYWVQAETDPPAVQAQENDYWVPAPTNEAANPPVSEPNDYWVSNAMEESDSPVAAPNDYWIQAANEEEVTEPPNDYWVQQGGKNKDKEDESEPPEPALTPEITLEEANEETTAPVAVTLSPTMYPTVTTNGAVETPSDETPSNETAPDGPYGVRLPPLYLYVTIQGLVNEENFLDVMVAYMQYYMEGDFQDFHSITYGVTTYSMITTYSSVSKSTNSLDNPVSNITAHIHRLTAVFNNKPTDLDWEIKDYMEMLLEDDVRMAEYVEIQPNLEFSILASTLEYEDAVPPTNVNTANGASKGEDEDDKKRNMMVIIGWTIGAFVLLLWVVLLYGIQSRGAVVSSSS